jgi:hypothetical protein
MGFRLLVVLILQVLSFAVDLVGWTTGYLVRAAGRAGTRLF